MHALIIEDNQLIAFHVEAILRDQGFGSFTIAETEAAAIAAAEAQCPDIITADVQLRSGTGVAAVRAICARRAIPVVYVTGNPHALSGVPAAVVVQKPFTEARLVQALRQARAAVAAETPSVLAPV